MNKTLMTGIFLLSSLIFMSCTADVEQGTCWYSNDTSIDLADLLCNWTEHPSNPLIQPAEGDWLIGDPAVIQPDEAPDGVWHMFAYGFLGIHHLTSPDGIAWEMLPDTLFGMGVVRPFVFTDQSGLQPVYYIFVEQYAGMDASEMLYSTSADLLNWETPVVLLKPELSWETDPNGTIGNPYLMYRADLKQYWLYYSASNVFIPECNFYEPRHIGVATADNIMGPYTKNATPLISPDLSNPLMNMGAGSIKLLDEKVGGRFIALNNGIYKDNEGKSRSAIEVLSSADGLKWDYVCDFPIVKPSHDGWKKAFVYAFDTVREGDQIRMYFNARDEWAEGVERIGMATLDLPCSK
jgi:hypothetical protein